ncbi:hypothetical protein FZ029_17850 [Azospirillum sp. Sh1]|nr:hypothetical protein FZ029_17850 [Azospirillum sp. Sh1]
MAFFITTGVLPWVVDRPVGRRFPAPGFLSMNGFRVYIFKIAASDHIKRVSRPSFASLDRHSREGGNPALSSAWVGSLDPRLRGDDGRK